jgi:hypothetical protein
VVECLYSKCRVLSSNPNTAIKKITSDKHKYTSRKTGQILVCSFLPAKNKQTNNKLKPTHIPDVFLKCEKQECGTAVSEHNEEVTERH